MKIISVTFKGVFPYGPELQHIDFVDGEFYTLNGVNGAGKSSFKDIIIYGLYGQLDDVNVSEIPNDLHQDGFIDLSYSVGKHNYRNLWSFRPNDVQVFKDGSDVPMDLGGISAARSHIQDHILDIPFHVFCNIICINVDSFKSFLNMNAKDGRLIRDTIFGLDIVNRMLEILKKDRNLPNLSVLKDGHDSLETRLEDARNRLRTAKSEYDTEAAAKISSYRSKLVTLRRNYEEITGKIDELDSKMKSVRRDIDYVSAVSEYHKSVALTAERSKLLLEKKKLEEDLATTTECVDDYKLYLSYHVANDIANRHKSLKIDVDRTAAALSSYKSTLESLDGLIADINDKIKPIKNSITILGAYRLITTRNSHANSLKNNTNKKSELVKQQEQITDRITSAKIGISKLESELATLKTHAAAHEAGVCHACGSTFDGTDGVKIATKIDEVEDKITANRVVINSMGGELSGVRSEIKLCDDAIDIDKNKITAITGKLEPVLAAMPEDNLLARAESILIDNSVDSLKAEHSSLMEELANAADKKGVVVKELDECQRNLDTLQTELNNIGTIPSYKETDLSEDEVKAKLSNFNHEISEHKSRLSKITNEILTIDHQLKSLTINKLVLDNPPSDAPTDNKIDEYKLSKQKQLDGIVVDLNDCNNKRDNLVHQGNTIRALIEDHENRVNNGIAALEDLVQSIEQEVETSKKTMADARMTIAINKVSEYALGSQGIKSFILKDVVPHINDAISAVLSRFQVPFTLQFDSEFQPVITRNGNSIRPSRLSTGQRKMANFVILLAITRVLKIKYPSLNLLFYDEISSSLSGSNTNIVLSTIRDICCDELGMCTVIMQHGSLPLSYFDSTIQIEVINHVSTATKQPI